MRSFGTIAFAGTNVDDFCVVEDTVDDGMGRGTICALCCGTNKEEEIVSGCRVSSTALTFFLYYEFTKTADKDVLS